MTDNKSLDIGKKYYGNTVHIITDLTPFIELATIVDEMSREGRINDIRRVIANNYVEQRTKDLNKLSFHTGTPVEVLEGYLRSKD